jgi:threonyl-tRNA synthetase
MEEAKARDHRKLGKELDLYSFHPWAPASPFFHPKGTALYNMLFEYLRAEYARRGYQEVVTPQIFDADLFKLSGHYQNYHENMYWTVIDEREFGVKPMNCPGHFLLYNTRLWSYRDLPVRYADFGRLHRYELSGVTAGLTRVRTFSQDDAHIFTPFEKVEDEIFRFLDFVDAVYAAFGFTEVEVSLGLRPEKRIGADELWDRGEKALAAALEKASRKHIVSPGDGAFYGPKIDFRVKDALGRPWQLGTIQIDFEHAESFDMTYIGEDGQQHRTVVMHRAILGSFERFLGILVEHTAGNFPFWIAPVQAVVLPVSEKFNAAADAAAAKLKDGGLRVEVDEKNEKLGARIRKAEMQKTPAMLVVGEKEAAAGTVSVRLRHGGDAGTHSVENFLALARTAIAERWKELTLEVKNR